MKKIDEINLLIDSERENLDYLGFMNEYITPSISSFPVKGNPHLCSLDTRNIIKNKFINQKFPDNMHISEELYDRIAEFMLSDNISIEDKLIVNKYLDENIKKYIFDTFFKKFTANSKYIEKSDFEFDTNIFYHPRINGVPLGNIFSREIVINTETLYNILIGKEKAKDINEFMCVKSFFDSNNYFSMPWCFDDCISLKREYDSEENEQKYWGTIETFDECKINSINNSKKVEHKAKTSNSLKEEILKDIPKEYNLLEKSIYVYVKLSQLLTYNPIYYFNYKIESHLNAENISNYDVSNNKIVCYEFSYILSDLLNEIGVTSIKEQDLIDNKFHNKHANIEYLVNDIAIFADSTTSVQEGDLSTSNFSFKLSGIRCSLFDQNKQNEFKKSKEKVINDIYKEYEIFNKLIPPDLEIQKMNIIDRLILFNNYVANCELTGFKFVSYVSYLIDKLKINNHVIKSVYTDNKSKSKVILKISINPYCNSNDKKISYFIDSDTKNIIDYNMDEYIAENKITF